jgi:hypothetical protein
MGVWRASYCCLVLDGQQGYRELACTRCREVCLCKGTTLAPHSMRCMPAAAVGVSSCMGIRLPFRLVSASPCMCWCDCNAVRSMWFGHDAKSNVMDDSLFC